MIRLTIINIVLRYSRTISNNITMPPITMRSRLQVVSMVMEMEGDGYGGCGAMIPLSLDKIDLRSLCKSFYGASLFAVA
jgi:hypothetical protein